MTDISFLTESVTGVDRCCKEIVGIDLPECCLGTEFNLLTAAAYYEPSTNTPADPPPADPADEPAPAPAAPAPAGTQEPAARLRQRPPQ